MPDLRPSPYPYRDAFGVASTVTPKGGAPVAEVPVIFEIAETVEANADPSIADQRYLVSVWKGDVPDLPIGSTILAPAEGVAGRAPILYTVGPTGPLDPEWHKNLVHE